MSLVSFFGGVKMAKIGPVTISCSVSETHSSEAQVTEHPVETGSDVADHRTVRQDRLSMEGIISDASTDLVQEAFSTPDADIGKFSPVGRSAVQESYEKLVEMTKSTDVFDVVTSLRLYTDMTFTKFSVKRDAQTNAVIAFSAEMVGIQFVSSIAIGVDIPAAPTKSIGKQAAAKATPKVQAASTTVLNDLSGGKKGLSSFVNLAAGR